MKRIRPFNRLDITSGTFRFLEDLSQDEIHDRMTDGSLRPGILQPAGALSDEIYAGLPGVFAPSMASSGIHYNVDLGIAYDQIGERIAIPIDDNVLFNERAPLFSTIGIDGTAITPFSPGRIDIPDPDPTNTKSETEDAGTGLFTRYIFIAYLDVVRSVSLRETSPSSPDHQNDSTGTFTVPFPNRRKPITGKDRKTGTVYAHEFIGGYRIYTARLSEVTLPGATGLPILGNFTNHPTYGIDPVDADLVNPSLNPFSNIADAIYIGKFIWSSSGGGSIVPGSLVPGDSINPRQTFATKSLEIGIVGDKGSSTVPAVKTSIYVSGQASTLQEHVGAVGTGIVTEINPHGNAVIDFTSGFATPDNITYQDENSESGINDPNNTSNSQPSSTALTCQLVNSLKIAANTITVALPQDMGSSRTGTIVDTNYAAHVQVTPLATGQSVYIAGYRISEIRPTYNDAGGSLSGNSGIMPFISGDPVGNYVIFLMPDTATAGIGILGKTTFENLEDIPSVLSSDRWPIATVYWTGNELQTSEFNAGTTVNDLRSFGTVGKPNISGEGFIDPNKGIMALSVFENIAANGNFFVPAAVDTPTVPDSWNLDIISGGTTAASIQIIDSGTVGDVISDGPRAINALEIIVSGAGFGNTYEVNLDTYAPQLKENTLYTVSMWLKNVEGNNVNISLFGSFNGYGNVSLSYCVASKEFIFDRDATGWQRVAITLKTNAAYDPALFDPITNPTTVAALRIKILNANVINTPAFGTSGNIYIADVCVVEGDWITGMVAPKVNSGEIFMWDKTTSCPPGSIEVTELRNRLPLGASLDHAIGTSIGAGQTGDIISVIGGIANIGGHYHSCQGAGLSAGGFPIYPGDSPPGGWGAYWKSDSGFQNTSYAGSATVSVSGTEAHVSEYVLLFCRRL